MSQVDEGLIHAWIDGQLPADEAERVEALVASSPEWAAAAAEARGFVAASSRILSALDHQPAGVIPAAGGSAVPKTAARRAWYRDVKRVLPMAATFAVMIAGSVWLAGEWERDQVASIQSSEGESSERAPERSENDPMVAAPASTPARSEIGDTPAPVTKAEPAKATPAVTDTRESAPVEAATLARERATTVSKERALAEADTRVQAQTRKLDEVRVGGTLHTIERRAISGTAAMDSSSARSASGNEPVVLTAAPATFSTLVVQADTVMPDDQDSVVGSGRIALVMERQAFCNGMAVTEYRLPQMEGKRVTMVAGVVGDSAANWVRAMACLASESGVQGFQPPPRVRRPNGAAAAQAGVRGTRGNAAAKAVAPQAPDSLRWIDPRTNRAYLLRGNVDQLTLARIKVSLDPITSETIAP